MQSSTVALEAQALTKTYPGGSGTTALSAVSLAVTRGEFLGIMGPSGSGKTTLLNILSTIDAPTSGQVVFDGQILSSMSDKQLALFRRAHIGFIFQDFNLLDNLTVRDNIALPLVLSGKPPREILYETRSIAVHFGIQDHLDKPPYQLSGGQRQRAAAARAMITGPSVLFADEPTGALDSKAAQDLLTSFEGLHKSFSATIVMVTHDAFAASFCDRVLFLKDGQIYGRLDRADKRQVFFQSILDTLGAMGGVDA